MEENAVLNNRINELKRKSPKSDKNNFGSTIYNEAYNFYIDTDNGNYIENEDNTYHSYTFPITRLISTDTLENILFSLRADGAYDVFLVKYDFTEQEKLDIVNGYYFDLEDTFSTVEIDASLADAVFQRVSQTCTTVLREWCTGEEHHDSETGYDSCTAYHSSFNENCTYSSNGGSGGGPPINEPNPPNNPNTSHGGGGNGPYNVPVTTPTPKVLLSWEKIIKCIPNVMKIPNATSWLQDLRHKRQVGQMWQYLDDNECSEEASAFSEMAIKAWLDDGEVDFDEEIIKDKSFENNQRLNCVYNKFKETDNTISNYLENFLGERPVAHLKLTADTNFQTNFPDNPNAGAATSPPQDYIIEITFNTDPNSEGAAQNMPTIVLASDLIHEMLHAEIFRKLLSVAQQPEIPWSEDFIESHRNDFPTLMEYYCRWHYGNPTQPAATAQHQLIADYYRTMIKAALKDFDNNSHTESFYEMLSWSGLVGTVAWNNLGGLQNQYINQFNDIVENETHECSN